MGLKNPVEGGKAPGIARLCNYLVTHELVTKFIDLWHNCQHRRAATPRNPGIRYERTELGVGRLVIGDLRSYDTK